MQMRVWRTMMSHERRSQRLSDEDFVSRLKSLYEANPDVETGADACIAYYQKAKFGNMKERLDFLRWAKTQWKSNEKAGSFFSTTEKALFDKNVSVAVGGHLSSGIPFPVKVTHRNVPGVKLTVKNGHKKTVLTREVVSADYKDSPDYAEYNITDTVMLNLPPGTYTLTAEAAGEKEQTKVFTLSSLKLTCYALPELGSVVCVSDVVTGRPVSKCKVILSDYDYVQGKRKEFKKEVFTDKNGLVYASADGERWTEAKAVRNSDDASNELYIYNYDAHGNDSRLVKFYKLFSDRAIYRPGQTVYVSGYCYKREGDNYQMLAGQVIAPVLRLVNMWQYFQQIRVSMARLGDIMDEKSEPAFNPNRTTLPQLRGEVVFDKVNFRYKADGKNVLTDVSVKIEPGAHVGIVGRSGSGKSTLTKLVQRLYVPESGRVMIDGVDIAQVETAWLRRQIGIVLQENFLFAGSIRENIAIAMPNIDDEAVLRAAKLAGVDDFVRDMPQGYDTFVGERGSLLSGGQRQRVAIARALLLDPRILIFDEATSALDTESEQKILANMGEIVKGRTTITIAHRLSTVRGCDAILAMDHGRIVEAGTHEQLMAHKGYYYHLYMAQE